MRTNTFLDYVKDYLCLNNINFDYDTNKLINAEAEN
jgi:hypothetical protein